MDDVVRTLVIVLLLSLGVTLLGGFALFGAIDRGTTPNTALLVASLVLLVVDLWYAKRLFATPEQLGGSE